MFIDTVIAELDNYQSMTGQVLVEERTRKGFEALVLDLVYRGFEQLRQRKAPHLNL